jgi:hypothetical protein
MNSVFEPDVKDEVPDAEFFDIESSTRKDVRTATGNN